MPLLGAGGLAGKEQGKGVVPWEKFFLQLFFFLFQCALRADTQTRAPRDRVTLPVSQDDLTPRGARFKLQQIRLSSVRHYAVSSCPRGPCKELWSQVKGATSFARNGRQRQSHLTQMSQVGIKGRAFLEGEPGRRQGAWSLRLQPKVWDPHPSLEGDPRGQSGSRHSAKEFLFCPVGATSEVYREQSSVVPSVIRAVQRMGRAAGALTHAREEMGSRALAVGMDRGWPLGGALARKGNR